MFNFTNKQYVFKQASGNIWNIYYDEYAGLCYSSLTKRNTWTDVVSVQKNILPYFHANMDQDDHFHILFQDPKGNIFYTRLDTNISTIPVLSGKSPSTQNKHLYLMPFRNTIHLFYVLPHNNSHILAQQTIRDNIAAPPVVVDYVVNNSRPFSILYNNSGDIYAFYQANDGKYSQIGYKKLSQGSRSWSEFIQITRFEGNCEFISAIIDSKDIIHISYQRYNSRQYELVYQQTQPERTLWTNEIIIQSSHLSFESSFLLNLNSSLILYWTREDAIFYSSSSDGGVSWNKTQRYNFPSVKQLHCISYRSNASSDMGRISGDIFPGNFINGLKLAFYQDNNSASLTAEELRNLILDGLKALKANVDDLKEADRNNKDDILRISNSIQNFERELVKFSLKLNRFENEMNQLKAASGKSDKPLVQSNVEDLEEKME